MVDDSSALPPNTHRNIFNYFCSECNEAYFCIKNTPVVIGNSVFLYKKQSSGRPSLGRVGEGPIGLLRRRVRQPLLVEDILTQGLVLGLCLVRQLIRLHLRWVSQTHGGRGRHNTELGAVVSLLLGYRVVLQIALSSSRATATAVAPVAGDSDKFLFLSENFA